MSNRSEFSVGAMAKFAGAVADVGGTPEDLNSFAERPDVLRKALAFLHSSLKTAVFRILEPVNDKVNIPAVEKSFLVSDFFKVGTSGESKVKIYTIRSEFHDWFENQRVVIRDGCTISVHRIWKPIPVNQLILNERGLAFVTDLGMVRHLMELQPNCEEGILITWGAANIFCITDVDGIRRLVCVRSSIDGWRISAFSASDCKSEWLSGSQVFLPNP